MAEERKGFWQGVKDNVSEASRKAAEKAAERAASGRVDSLTIMTIYNDGTFTFKTGFGKESVPDRLLGIEHDIDSMRRKSTTGRGAAALMTGGVSLLASNNRGVVYVTVTGEETGVRTFTTQNPDNGILTQLRSLKAAGDAVIGKSAVGAAGTPTADMTEQLQRLAELHASGALTAEEFAAAKARLLG